MPRIKIKSATINTGSAAEVLAAYQHASTHSLWKRKVYKEKDGCCIMFLKKQEGSVKGEDPNTIKDMLNTRLKELSGQPI